MHWFTADVYRSTYEETINPLPAKCEWEVQDDFVAVQPPLMNKRQAGRPRENKRIPSRGEQVTQGNCSRCGGQGHHRDRCRSPMPSQMSSRSRELGTNNEFQAAPTYVDPAYFRDYIIDTTGQASSTTRGWGTNNHNHQSPNYVDHATITGQASIRKHSHCYELSNPPVKFPKDSQINITIGERRPSDLYPSKVPQKSLSRGLSPKKRE